MAIVNSLVQLILRACRGNRQKQHKVKQAVSGME